MLKAIDRVITALKKKEKEERDAALILAIEQMQQEGQQGQDMSMDRNRPNAAPSSFQQGNGQWYFYNPMAVSQGKTAFQQQWGRRENKDNWRRINQTVVNLGREETEPTDSVATAEGPEGVEAQSDEEEDEGDSGDGGRPEVRGSTRRWRGLWRSSEACQGGEGRPVAMATASDGDGCARVRSGKREPGRRESERE